MSACACEDTVFVYAEAVSDAPLGTLGREMARGVAAVEYSVGRAKC